MSWMDIYGIHRARNKRKIQECLDGVGLNQAMIAARAGVSEPAVSCVISGKRHSPAVLNALREAGVPEKLLCDPRRGAREAVA